MFKFLKTLAGASVPQQNENVIFDETTGYLHFDIEDDNTVARHTVKTPLAASVPWSGVTNKPEFTTEINVTLSANSWSNQNTYTITNSAITATVSGYIGVAPTATSAQREAAREAMICITSQSAGSLMLTADADDAPEVDIPVVITLLAD